MIMFLMNSPRSISIEHRIYSVIRFERTSSTLQEQDYMAFVLSYPLKSFPFKEGIRVVPRMTLRL